jgi:predicted PurR-regulated permease PerM
MSRIPPQPPAPRERLRRVGIAAWSIIGILILLVVAIYFLEKIRVIFPPLVLALFLIYLLNPLITRLEHRGIPRLLGALLSFILFFGGLALAIVAMVPLISDQVEVFGRQLPEFRRQIAGYVTGTAETIDRRLGTDIDTTQVTCLLGEDGAVASEVPSAAECDEVTNRIRDQLGDQAGRFAEIGLSVLEGLLVFILAPLLALYLLIDLPKLQAGTLQLLPESYRDEVAELGSKVGRAVGGFFRGQLFVAFIVGCASAAGFWIIGLPFWLVIGVIAGFFNLLPLVGPFIGGAIGFVVGTVTGGVGLGLQAAAVELVVQQVDNHIISPNVMKRAVQLHPVTVMLSLLAGGALAGFWGVLLGVPAIAVAKLVLGHLWATRVLGRPATTEGLPAGPSAGAPPTASTDEPGGEDKTEPEVPQPSRTTV